MQLQLVGSPRLSADHVLMAPSPVPLTPPSSNSKSSYIKVFTIVTCSYDIAHPVQKENAESSRKSAHSHCDALLH